MSDPDKPRTSFAREQDALHSGNRREETTREAFIAARMAQAPNQGQVRESDMVARSQLRPELRPSPSLAMGSDVEAFNTRWEIERRNAQQFQDRLNANERNQAMTDESNAPIPERNAPRDVLRDGNLKASLWSNDGDKGPFYSATLARTWRDEEGQLHDSHSFAGNELLRVSELARSAYSRTQELRREDQQQTQTRDAQPQQQQRPEPAPMPQREQAQTAREPSVDTRREAFIQQRQEQQPAPQHSHDKSR